MYRIFGYNEFCENFDFTVDNFVKAVKFIKGSPLSVIFVKGFCPKVCNRLGVF